MTRITFLLLVFAFTAAQCANILGVTTMISHSHHLWNEKLVEGLLKNGHNVTLLSHDKAKIKHTNYTVILLEGGYEKIRELFDYEDSLTKPESADISNFWKLIGLICAHDLSTEGLKTLMKYPEEYKFDLIIWDLNAGECLYPLIKRFGNPPVVGVSPFGLQPYISYMMGNHYFNYIPFYGTASSGRIMSFWERLTNTFSINYHTYLRINSYLPEMHALAIEHFGESLTEPPMEVERNLSLALVNSDAIFNFPEAVAPNIIPVGGLQIEPAKPIQKDLRKVFEATNGVILFSLGSNIQAEFLNSNMMDHFNRCFETLPYTIVMKLNNTHHRKFPKNVITRPWLQINDILGHPKTKLFISHGGALSTQEAMYHGVPIIGIPFFVDQIGNVAKLVERKIAERLELDRLSPEHICHKITTVLENSTNDQHKVFRCWAVVEWFEGWKRAVIYGPLGGLPIVFPNRLWLSYVAGGQLIALAIFHLTLSFKDIKRRRRKDRLLHPDIDSYESSRFEEVTEVLDDGLPEPMPGSSHSLSDSLAEQDAILEI